MHTVVCCAAFSLGACIQSPLQHERRIDEALGERMPRGGQVKTELRKKIRELFNSGETLVSIAEKLGKAPSTIAYHVRALGVPPIKHFRALPLTDGKRRCSACGRWKTPNLFPSGANPLCTKCHGEGKQVPSTSRRDVNKRK